MKARDIFAEIVMYSASHVVKLNFFKSLMIGVTKNA